MDRFLAQLDGITDQFSRILGPVELVTTIVTIFLAISTYAASRGVAFKFLYRFHGSRRKALVDLYRAGIYWSHGPRPLERARIFTEIFILKNAKISRQEVKMHFNRHQNFEKNYKTQVKDLADIAAGDFHKEFSIIDINTPADLDEKREEIQRYFEALEGIEKDRDSFITFTNIADGFIAPAFLIAGLMTRFKEDWQPIIRKYKDVVNSTSRNYSHELEELRAFQFTCWLLWGPSIPLCTCDLWRTKGEDSGGNATRIMQYGFGDEANCVDILINHDKAHQIFRSLNQPNHVGAIDSALCGRIMWGVPENVLSSAQDSLRNSEDADGRVILQFIRRDPHPSNQAEFNSKYYSAYVWVMFTIKIKSATESDTQPADIYHGKESYRNLLPFFEHGNIADASTLHTIKNNLVAKSISALKEVILHEIENESHMRQVVLEYVCASDHSGCGSKHRFDLPIDCAAKNIVLNPTILETLRKRVADDPFFNRPNTQYLAGQDGQPAHDLANAGYGRLILPELFGKPARGDKRSDVTPESYASCDLPRIVENFTDGIKAKEPAANA